MNEAAKPHRCEFETPYKPYGAAFYECYETADGTFWATNHEYTSQVNFCPFCGKEASSKVELKPVEYPCTDDHFNEERHIYDA